MRWSRIRWSTIVDLFSQSQPSGARLALEDRPIAEVTLLILLVQSAIVAGLCILLPLALLERRGLQIEGRWAWIGYFAALGLGFIMVEIALLQHFLLFLGQPIYTYCCGAGRAVDIYRNWIAHGRKVGGLSFGDAQTCSCRRDYSSCP